MENDELKEEIENILYSKIHHASNIENIINIGLTQANSSESSNRKARYWKNHSKNFNFDTVSKKRQHFSNEGDKIRQERREKESMTFVPYSSVLVHNSKELSTKKTRVQDDEEKKSVERQFGNKFKTNFTTSRTNEMEISVTKAKESIFKNSQHNSGGDDDDDDNSVIFVEIPDEPSTLIDLDDSSDDEIIKRPKKMHSPSTSSIISDDFIAPKDKLRLIQPFSHYDENVDLFSTKEGGNRKSSKNENIVTISDEERNVDNDSIYGFKFKSRKKNAISTISTFLEEDNNICVRAKSQVKPNKTQLDEVNFQKESCIHETCLSQQMNDDVKLASKISSLVKPLRNFNVPISKNYNIKESISNTGDGYSDSEDSIKAIDNNSVDYDLHLNVCVSREQLLSFKKDSETTKLEIKNKAEIGWNDEMRYFYNDYRIEDFNLSFIKNSMPSDPVYWKINSADRSRYIGNERKYRCRNCNEKGHLSVNCKKPRKKICCIMCGKEGHKETRCSSACCLRCGESNQMYVTSCSNCCKLNKRICPLCNFKGHDLDQCPDKWRRYHSTIDDALLNELDVTYRRNKLIFCSICASPGHFNEECTNFNKTIQPFVTSSWFTFSNKISYTKDYSFETKSSGETFELVTYLKNYSFNLTVPSNCRFYPQFKQNFLTYMEKKEDKNSKSGMQRDEKMQTHEAKWNINEKILINNISLQTLEKYNMKMLLSKDHATILMSKEGTNFLLNICKRLNLVTQFKWNSQGNLLIVNGIPSSQEIFQNEVREFLFGYEVSQYEKILERSIQVPKILSTICNYIKNNLQSIKCLSVRETKQILNNFCNAKRVMDFKKAVKYRRSLNIAFFGYAQMLEGSTHLNELRKILADLEKEIIHGNGNTEATSKLRNRIFVHTKYIFSANDRGNYVQLFNDYRKILNRKQKYKSNT